MKQILRFFVAVVALISLFLSIEAQANIYKCVNAKAEVFYNDKPCHWTQIERKVRAAKAPKNGYIPAPFSPSDVEGEGQQYNNKRLVVGGNSLNNDTSSKNQTGGNSTSAEAYNANKNNNSTEMNSKKNTVASTDSPNLNATLSQAKTSKPKKRLME